MAHMIVLGRLISPYGVRGWFNLHPFADDPGAWCDLPQWWLAADPDKAKTEADWRVVKVENVREHGKGLVVKLSGVDDRNASEALHGFYVAVPREAMPATDDDEFYWDDLVGLAVQNEQGASLGRVMSIISAASSDVLVVQEGEQERLIPFVDQVVKQVDVKAGLVTVAWERDW